MPIPPDRQFWTVATITLGIATAGWFVGNGFARGRTADQFVTVKGVAEREVQADLALWPIRLVATNNDLARAQAEIARAVALVYAFLATQSIDTSEVELQDFRVTDLLAERFRGGEAFSSRYIINQTVMVRSNQPEAIQAASQRVGDLVRAGVVLSSGQEWGPSSPTFLFQRLNDLKPEMIAEATRNAREAAEQFALDARSSVGNIRRANQGVFVILPRDQATGVLEEQQLFKIVRVVTTVEYFLEN